VSRRPARPAEFRHAVVTGGAGFLGSHLCEALLADDAEVHCLDSFLTGTPTSVEHLLCDERLHLHRCDVTNRIHIPGRVDLVLHFASPASPLHYIAHPIETLNAGSAGTLNALELAREKGARFVLASTSEVYGDPLVHPQPETYWGNVNPVGPRSVYDEAKRYAEALTTAYRTTHDVDTAIVRIFNTYGPRMRYDDGRAVPTFINQALAGAPLTVDGDGTQTRSLCYVDDLIRGVLAVARSDLAGPINIGSPDEMTVLRIAEDVIRVVGGPSKVEFRAAVVDDPKQRHPDIGLIERELGWGPKVDWLTGLQSTVRWFSQRWALPVRQH
jgi:dTDP-glucose 4,6-dehydratase